MLIARLKVLLSGRDMLAQHPVLSVEKIFKYRINNNNKLYLLTK